MFDAVESVGCVKTSLFLPGAHRGQHANKTGAEPSFCVVLFLRKQFIGLHVCDVCCDCGLDPKQKVSEE